MRNYSRGNSSKACRPPSPRSKTILCMFSSLSKACLTFYASYVLERHLLRDEMLLPRVEIGRFRGEPVFARANVISGLKTSENWMRSGRVVVEGEQPLKWVKVRAVTLGRRRALGIAGEASHATHTEGDGATQGLYAESQTEIYHPPPVTNVSQR